MEKRKLFQPILQAAHKSSGKYKANLSVDKLILNGKSYSSDDLSKQLQPQNLCNVVQGDKLAFFTSYSKLSNHYRCKFTHCFSSSEQYCNFMKAKHFKDDERAASILDTDTPVAVLNIGKRINFRA